MWSPRGDLIAYTRTGAFQIGVMTPDGSGARTLTSGGYAEGPSWAPNGRAVMFTRGASAGQLWYVDVASGAVRQVRDAARRIGPGLVAVTQLRFFTGPDGDGEEHEDED